MSKPKELLPGGMGCWINVVILFFIIIGPPTAVFSQPLSSIESKTPRDKELARKEVYYRNLGYALLPRYPGEWVIPSGKYVAIDDIAISRGQMLTLESGTAIYFEAGKRILIDGKFVSNGTFAQEVLLTNIPFSQSYIPVSAEDSLWGGLVVGEIGCVVMSRTSIKNSRKGIFSSGNADSLRLDCVDISGVRADRLTIRQRPKIFADSSCLSFAMSETAKPVALPQRPAKGKNNAGTIWGISTGAFFCSTVVAGILTSIFYEKARNGSNPDKVNRDGNAAKTAWLSTQILGGATVAAGTGFTITFFIHRKNHSSLK